VTPASDRMGYRLAGPAPWPDAAAGILSGPVVTGAIQIPPGGEPILLMADRQTTGGYAVAAVVCEADLGLAGQLAPGDAVCFREIELMDALAARAARRRQLDVWRRGRPGA
jgi:antagonist of KipI